MRIRVGEPSGPGTARRGASRPGPLVTGCLDVVLGLLAVALESLICGVVLYARTRPEPGRARPVSAGQGGIPAEIPGPRPTAGSGPSAMDWSATLTLASFTAAACLIGVVLLRHGLPLAGVVQLLAACVLCVLTFLAWHSDYRLAHPASAAPPRDRTSRSAYPRTGGRPPQPMTTLAPGTPWSPRAAGTLGDGFTR
ncbi:hypothetical protein [Streptomyces sp. NPDC001743]|uniref:hypothetical protein n=1 Tax=Streptomyces sp. NPDC001743 TaxID=3154397 RepID=UPI003317AD12